jgi:hypothetical protein
VMPQSIRKKCNVIFRYLEKPAVHAMQGTPRGDVGSGGIFIGGFLSGGWGGGGEVIDPMGHPPQENGGFFGGFDSVDCWCHTANKPHHNSVPDRRSSGETCNESSGSGLKKMYIVVMNPPL